MTGRGEYNLEMLELWLGAYAGGYEGPYDDNVGGHKPNKQTSKMPINVLWMEANEDPKVQETDKLLRWIVLEEMPNRKPYLFSVIRYLYLREHSNPADEEYWRKNKHGSTAQARYSKKLYESVQDAKRWILRRVQELSDGFVLVVPDPINPKGFVQKSKRDQTIAIRVYWQERQRHGDLEARRRAAKASGYTLRHLRNIIPKERDNG